MDPRQGQHESFFRKTAPAKPKPKNKARNVRKAEGGDPQSRPLKKQKKAKPVPESNQEPDQTIALLGSGSDPDRSDSESSSESESSDSDSDASTSDSDSVSNSIDARLDVDCAAPPALPSPAAAPAVERPQGVSVALHC